MKRRTLPIILSLLSLFVVGRIGLSVWQPMEQTGKQLVAVAHTALPTSIAVDKEAVGVVKDKVELWDGNFIPSAEAAAEMPIAEEKETSLAEGVQNSSALRAAREKLIKQEKSLQEREKVAQAAEESAVKRIDELKALEARIQDLLDQEKAMNDKKIKRLTAVYEGMKADKAAPVIAQMKLTTVVKMFSRMNEKQVGKILSFLPPKQAVEISQALTKRIGAL